MKLYMYDTHPNFGDVLNRHIWPRYLGRWLARTDDVLMFGIGTLLGQDVAHTGRVIVCGSGCGYEAKTHVVRDRGWEVFFVRGPLSAQVLGLPQDKAVADPGILVTECFPKAEPSGRVAFMPHWETACNPLWKSACRLADIDYIDPLGDVPEIIRKISGARLVIAEAMHAAIVADAYRVPWVAASTSLRVNRFKWRDWGSSLNMDPLFHALPGVGMSDFFRELTGDEKTARHLQQELDGKACGVTKGPLACLNLLYCHGLPQSLRHRIDYRLTQKIGPAFDRLIDRRADAPYIQSFLHKRAQQLATLGNKPGMLSDEALINEKRARIHEKIRDVERYLEQNP